MNIDPFHPGEHAAQRLADVHISGAPIRGFMPDQHRDFFALLPFLPIATRDDSGAPIATILTGLPGFVVSPDSGTLRIMAHPAPGDPIAPHFTAGTPVGILGIDLATRRRNRANGSILSANANGLTVAISESFGNCPQYIQTRVIIDASASPQKPEFLSRLDADARAAIGSADTLFVASGSGSRDGMPASMDISHRGGRPGFVRVDGDVLTIPDFRGNRYFNTLGNFVLDPRAALLFVDFFSGDLLHLTGTVEILWEQNEEIRSFAGAERLWRIKVTRGWRRRSALPFRWNFQNYAPTTEQTGTWVPPI